MTKRQEKILETALQLFAERGYANTSTSLISSYAGVSEGLIFRHFKSKEGLLKAIMQMGKEKALKELEKAIKIKDPENALRAIVQIPFKADKNNYHFWRLFYTLKWQTELYDHSISAPIKKALKKLFTELKYDQPSAEAELVLMLMDGIATSVLLRKPKNQKAIVKSVLEKYNL